MSTLAAPAPARAVVLTPRPPRLGHRPALDGMRAIAIGAVMAGHSNIDGFHSGLLGVDVFFVLSGFLITTLLAEEWESRGEIHFGRFYLRRVLRLYPGLVAALGAWAIYSLFRREEVWEVGRQSLLVLTYTVNLAVARWNWTACPGFMHGWSLAAEEQFYLVWPILLWLLLRSGARPSRIAACLFALTALLPLYTWSIWGENWWRFQFAPDTRATGLLVGCALALWLRGRRMAFSGLPLAVLRMLGAASVVFFAWCFFFEKGDCKLLAHFLWRQPGACVATAVLILVCLQPKGVVGRVLALPPLVWIGRLSYSLYLWHPLAYGVFEDFAPHGLRWSAAKLGSNLLALVLAVASHYLVERPFLRMKDRMRKT